MQSTDTDQASLDALAEYALSSNLRNDPLVIDLCTALAAERDRADRAEAALAEAWDEGYDASATDWENGGPGNPNPYRSEATA
jgi:hypothetical protein